MIGQNENDDLENTAIVIYDVILDIPDFAATMYTILYLKNLNVLSPICTGVRRSASVCPIQFKKENPLISKASYLDLSII